MAYDGATKDGVKKVSRWLPYQTHELCGLIAISVMGLPGHLAWVPSRSTEIALETFFGSFRSQFSSSQMRCRDYIHAGAKRMHQIMSGIKDGCEVRPHASSCPAPVTEDEFVTIANRALASAIRLMAYTKDEVLEKYMVFCKKNVMNVPEIDWNDCFNDQAGKDAPDLDDLSDGEASAFDHEETVELGDLDGLDLEGAYLECFQLLSQLNAREEAGSIGWVELEPGQNLGDVSESAARRLGCSTSAQSLPPPVLDSDDWNYVNEEDEEDEEAESRAEQKAKVAKTSKLFTLPSVFVADQELKSIDPLVAPLWQCLVNLRTGADGNVLPRPEKFRLTKRKLHWYNLAERQAACARAGVGLAAKRTSRQRVCRMQEPQYCTLGSGTIPETGGTQRGKQVKRKAQGDQDAEAVDEEVEKSKEDTEINKDNKDLKKPLKSLSTKTDKPKSKKLEAIPVPWIFGIGPWETPDEFRWFESVWLIGIG
eukprot:s3687_g2.t1